MLDLLEAARRRNRPLILGHRGAPRELVENTVASFKRALDVGADGVELDVRATADGVLVCHHHRTAANAPAIARLTYRQLRAAQWTAGIRLARLETVLKAVAGRGFADIEIKPPGIERTVIELARGLLPAGSYCFSSFNPNVVASCRHAAPSVGAFLILSVERTAREILGAVQACGANGVALRQSRANPQIMSTLCAHNIPAALWTVNRITRARWLAELGAAAIVTDDPRRMVQWFGQREQAWKTNQ